MSTDTDQQQPDSAPIKRDWHADAYEIRGPILVHSRADIAGLLRGHRMAKGLTCEDFDHRAGFSDRYVTKLENGDKPGMKRGVHIQPLRFCKSCSEANGRVDVSFSAEVWLETNDLSLVLMPRWQAEQLGAQPAPKREAA